MTFPPAFLDELRARVSLVDVVGRRVQYDRRKSNPGRNDFWACCPFHNEKTPSFHVDGRKGFYHCFGCGVKGDAIGFLMETERLSFSEAVETLAREAGLALPERTPQAREAERNRRSLHDLVEAAAKFFEASLAAPIGRAARDYIAHRKLSAETVRRFRLGYAPGSRSALRDHLTQLGATPADMLAAGLVIRPDDGGAPYDRFRNRLMFPILDSQERVIAFGGRALSPDAQPKYLNSPEGPLFHKGTVLYNVAAARRHARADGTVVVVEGYMDAIALDQAGLRAVVAPLGTALTEEHLALLWRIVQEPVVCFDGDDAGRRAAQHAVQRALPLLKPGHSLRVAFLPQGQDPDDLAQAQGRAGLEAVLRAALPLADVVWRDAIEAGPLDTPERRADLEARLGQQTEAIADRAVREHYRAEMRSRLDRLFGRGERRPFRPGRSGRNAPFQPPQDLPPTASVRRHPLASSGANVNEAGESLVLLTALLHPAILLVDAETLANCPFTDLELARLRDAMVTVSEHLEDTEPDSMRAQLAAAGLEASIARLFARHGHAALHLAKIPFLDAHAAWKRETARLWSHLLESECKEAEQALAADMTDENLARLVALKSELEALRRESIGPDPARAVQAGAEHLPAIDLSRVAPHIAR